MQASSSYKKNTQLIDLLIPLIWGWQTQNSLVVKLLNLFQKSSSTIQPFRRSTGKIRLYWFTSTTIPPPSKHRRTNIWQGGSPVSQPYQLPIPTWGARTFRSERSIDRPTSPASWCGGCVKMATAVCAAAATRGTGSKRSFITDPERASIVYWTLCSSSPKPDPIRKNMVRVSH